MVPVNSFQHYVRVERCWLHTLDNPSHGGMCVREPGQGHTEGPSFENSPKCVKTSARCEETTPESHVSDGGRFICVQVRGRCRHRVHFCSFDRTMLTRLRTKLGYVFPPVFSLHTKIGKTFPQLSIFVLS